MDDHATTAVTIGAKVHRYFANLEEWYQGEITQSREEDGKTLFHVHFPADSTKSYPDSDEEELDAKEALKGVQDYCRRTKQPKNKSPKKRERKASRSPLKQRNTDAMQPQRPAADSSCTTSKTLNSADSGDDKDDDASRVSGAENAPSKVERNHSGRPSRSPRKALPAKSYKESDSSDESVAKQKPSKKPRRGSSARKTALVESDSEEEEFDEESSDEELVLDDEDEDESESDELEIDDDISDDEEEEAVAPARKRKTAAPSQPASKKSKSSANSTTPVAKSKAPPKFRARTDHDNAEQIEAEIAKSHDATQQSRRKGRKATVETAVDDGDPSRNFVKKPYTAGDNLPIISDPQEMMIDMVSKLDWSQLLPMVTTMKTRTLKVATMCSGTEAPILALDMLQTAIRDRLREEKSETMTEHDIQNVFRIEHVFSCEIEPFKQAYIERNFQPPLLFRDIRELGQDQAYTAYGALRDVPNTPGTVDMLIAGTSCVDYSNLNTKKKTIDQKGESGQTFFGMMKWIEKAQPSVVIIENVSGAPWDVKVELFEERGYCATYSRLDTKDYYIPQTRQRGYLFAVRAGEGSQAERMAKRPAKWTESLKSLKRPASAALDAFMLANDDPRVLRGRARLTAESSNTDGESSRAGRVDWTKCETLHQQARSLENLGGRRPLTNWSDSTNTAMPSFAWNEWTNAQVHRIHDLMDINTLRLAKCGIDGSYKTMVWNLSQNVGRDTMGKLGLSQCLTPTGVPYVANRGGVLVGEELLMLQGIPAEDLLLTKESEANLKDFAGNGMSTTVVGAVMMCALLHAHDVVATVVDKTEQVGAIVHTLVPKPLVPASSVSIEANEENKKSVIDLGSGTSRGSDDFLKFLEDAATSAKKCLSEGDTECIESDELVTCNDCGLCARREHVIPPRKFEEHTFMPYCDKFGKQRADVDGFRRKLQQLLPMRLQFRNMDLESFDSPKGLPPNVWKKWKQAVADRTDENNGQTTFFFKGIQRSNIWTAMYASSSGGRLEVRITDKSVCWFFFVEPPSEQGKLRDLLMQPIARMHVVPPDDKSGQLHLLHGQWEVCLPESCEVTINVQDKGEAMPSWRNRLGLTGEYESEVQFEKLEVKVDSCDSALKKRIEGTYEALPKCGGACGSLRRKVDADGVPSMYLFLESGRKTLPDADSYVFSPFCHRTRYLEYRETELVLDPSFNPVRNQEREHNEDVVALTPGKWTGCQELMLDPLCSSGGSLNATLSCPTQAILAKQASIISSWQKASLITGCGVPIMNPSSFLAKLYRNMNAASCDVNLSKSTRVFRDLAFILSRLTIPQGLGTEDCNSWVTLRDKSDNVCQVCAPQKPSVEWRAVSKGKAVKFLPVEDGQQAAVYERALKERPSPWLLRLEGDKQTVKYLKLAFNAVSLTQRALGCFPRSSFAREQLLEVAESPVAECCHQWRIVPHTEKNKPSFPKLVFRSNKLDDEAKQPPNFRKFPLRKEQLRSLTWMLAQERSSEPFLEEEVSESILPNLNWRAEGRVQRPVLIRGGIIADEVGYGKTAITLGLIDSSDAQNGVPQLPKSCENTFIQTKATLIVVPQHLMGQWPEEVKKFLGGKQKVVVLKNMQSFNTTTIDDIVKADIVVASFQVLGNEMYYQHLARLCGIRQSSMPTGNKGGRHFEAVYSECLAALANRVPQIVHGCREVFASIQEDASRQQESTNDDAILLDGKKTVYKNTGKTAKAKESKVKGQKDPWGLSTAAVKTVYKKMKCPPLEMFFWKRIVVDEFTYLDSIKRERVLAFILGIRSSFRWFLSGTPNHANFNDIRVLATLLGVHLGVEETLPGTKLSKRGVNNSDATGLENLSLFLELRSMQWHERRHGLAQDFLDRFVRQNQAEHDEIPWEEHELFVDLPPVERAIYLELETHLRSLEMNSKNAQKSKKKSTGDRDSRMQEILQQSSSAEEALLKCCSHFNMGSASAGTSAIETIQDIISHRQHQKDELISTLTAMVTDAFRMQHCILREQPDWLSETAAEKGEMVSALKQYLLAVDKNESVTHGADDEVHAAITRIVKQAEDDFRAAPCQIVEGFGETSNSDLKGDSKMLESLFPMKLQLRDHMHNVRSTGKELCGRIRSLRYIEWIHKFQTSATPFDCSHCQRKGISTSEAGVLSSCGHIGCLQCLKKCASEEKCIEAPSCQARVSSAHVVDLCFFGQHVQDTSGGKFGKKLSTVVDKIQEIIDMGDRIIVFCQFDDLTLKIEEVLLSSNIKAHQVKGSVAQQIKSLSVFQKEKPDKNDPRVLLLKMDDEQSAGLNLTMLNHAIFVHPLLADSQQDYVAYETQAIGRIRRFGQSKTVHIHRFLVNDTIDTQIYDQRTKGTSSNQPGNTTDM